MKKVLRETNTAHWL